MQRTQATVTCSDDYVLCLSDEGTVLSIGYSRTCAHGFENYDINYSPTIISLLQNIISISISLYHSICLDDNGNVFTLW